MRPITERGQIIPHRVYSDRVFGYCSSEKPGRRARRWCFMRRCCWRGSPMIGKRCWPRVGTRFFICDVAAMRAWRWRSRSWTQQDWLHLHYRDKALLLARGIPVGRFFDSLLCNADSCSAGRQMTPFMADASRHVLAQNIPVGNHALQAVGIARAVRDEASTGRSCCARSVMARRSRGKCWRRLARL